MPVKLPLYFKERKVESSPSFAPKAELSIDPNLNLLPDSLVFAAPNLSESTKVDLSCYAENGSVEIYHLSDKCAPVTYLIWAKA